MSGSTDPADWRSLRIPELEQLDSLQRCLICKGFLKAPVLTLCNHVFCSQCIRQHLLGNSNCPLCKKEQFESNLKRVIVLEEMVSCFEALRSRLLEATQETAATKETAEAPKSPEVIDLDSEPDDGKVACPVCGDRMTANFLQRRHIDDCLLGKPKKREISHFFSLSKKQRNHQNFYFGQALEHHHEIKKLPKMDFASLSTAKIKEKLTALKLPTLGARPQLEARYNQYMVLHNANCDSSHPVLELELRLRLAQQERSHVANTPSLSHKSISDKSFHPLLWRQKFKSEFAELIVAARLTLRRQASTEREPQLPIAAETKTGTLNDESSAIVEKQPSPIEADFLSSVLFSP